MRSIVTHDFRKMLDHLPPRVQVAAREGFERWKQDRTSVGWKAIKSCQNLYSVQIGIHWRAVCAVSKKHQAAVWLFIGSHESYNHFLHAKRKDPVTEARLSGRLLERQQARCGVQETRVRHKVE